MQKKKLIEVAVPLEAINEASAREKSIRHGHPSTLHLWWARRPLASARAVLFASLVDDPSSNPDAFPGEKEQDQERKRLFKLIEDLVRWENSNNQELLARAHEEIRKSVGEKLPIVYDPFAGGGTIPLEAQRLGLEAHASDLNPVAVLINKAMIEIPPRFAKRPPVHPDGGDRLHNEAWRGAAGLAEDVRSYGKWMRDEAFRRIGHLYPQVAIPSEYGGGTATVIAWLWARTVPSPDPAFSDVHVPLVSSFWLSKKKGNEVYINPVVDGKSYRFEIRHGIPDDPDLISRGTKLSRGANFECLVSGNPMSPEWIKKQGKSGRMGAKLMAVVAEGKQGRVYLEASEEMEKIAREAKPTWRPEQDMPKNPRWFSPPDYGMDSYGDLFTPRQLVALTTFSDLIAEAREKVIRNAAAAGLDNDGKGIDAGGSGAVAYGDAVATYLAFGVDRLANRQSTICFWDNSRGNIQQTFSRQAIPMTWDFVEGNPFSNSTGNFKDTLEWISKVIEILPAQVKGRAIQADVHALEDDSLGSVFATDPPYYDNIGYADLSDYFYVWLRRSLKDVYPGLFQTLLVPKTQELVATPYRFEGDKHKAEQFFETGMKAAFRVMHARHREEFPLSLYYAFKQSEKKDEGGIASTGWETMLKALIDSGFQVLGTWPLRTEYTGNLKKTVNALASSIILVCRKRPADAPVTTRGKFIAELHEELSAAVRTMQKANIPPVDLQQAAIGPGMAVFSKYAEIREASGTMRIHDALVLINQHLDEILGEAESEYDEYTRWAVSWFEQFGAGEGDYGTAEGLAKAKVVSVNGMVDAGFLFARAGKVRLLRRDELDNQWAPVDDESFTIWETAQHLVRALLENGEPKAAELLADLSADQVEAVKQLCYRLFNTCENKKWAGEAQGYNALIASFPSIAEKARAVPKRPKQGTLL